jgi:predicted permease
MVTPGYLDALGATLREGRLHDERDRADGARAVVVNESFAKRYWAGESALGHRLSLAAPNAPWMTIVGVVSDVYENGYEIDIKPGIYVASSQMNGRADNLLVRVEGDPLAAAPAVQRIVGAIDPEQPVAAVRTMTQIVDLEVVDRRQQSIILGTFAALALVLASLGLYGLLSYSVAQRRREIGLRIVLGGTATDVTRSIAGQGLALAGIGLGAGVAIAIGSRSLMEGLLYGVQPGDPVTFGAVAALLAVVAALACWIPAHRAARLNPQIALQAE